MIVLLSQEPAQLLVGLLAVLTSPVIFQTPNPTPAWFASSFLCPLACYVSQKAEGFEGTFIPAAMALQSKEEIISHWLGHPGMQECVSSTCGLGRASDREDFSVSKSMPKAHTLVDGKVIDFSWDNNSSVFVQCLSEPKPCLILLLLCFVLFLVCCSEKKKLAWLKQNLTVSFFSSSWGQAGPSLCQIHGFFNRYLTSTYCVSSVQ